MDKPEIFNEVNNIYINEECKQFTYNIHSKEIGKHIYYYKTLDSTNTFGKILGKSKDAHGIVIIADEQTQGRGRLGREWISTKGDDIFMSIVLKPKIIPRLASMLTIIAAMAVNKAIRSMTNLPSKIKWPNDIIIHGKKVCGILTEMNTIEEQLEYVVVGIGVNVNKDSFPMELHNKATSIGLESGQTWDKNQLIVDILKEFEENYLEFMKCFNLRFLMNEYNKNLVNLQQEVRIIEHSKEQRGIALGINEYGGLLIKEEKGTIKVISSGEVSVRGIYGYI